MRTIDIIAYSSGQKSGKTPLFIIRLHPKFMNISPCGQRQPNA